MFISVGLFWNQANKRYDFLHFIVVLKLMLHSSRLSRFLNVESPRCKALVSVVFTSKVKARSINRS